MRSIRLSENNSSRDRPKDPGKDESRVRSVRSFLGLILCVLGLLSAAGGILEVVVGGAASASNVSAGAIGAVLSIVGYFMGTRRLTVATVKLSIVAIFFGLAASQGIILGFEDYDRGLPEEEPASQE
jgi:hypothetical protein